MTEAQLMASGGIGTLIKAIGKGRRLPDDTGEALQHLFGCAVGLEGLSRLFQPGFPGVRAFAIEARVAEDRAVELTVVGVARDGSPVWTSARAFVRGRDGGLEIHHGSNEIAPEYRSRNITVDLIQRELDLLSLLATGTSDRGARGSRITIDAEGTGSYICALHGFVFADETPEGPPVRSARALDPVGDRPRLLASVPPIVERAATRLGASAAATERALAAAERARTPWDLLRITFELPADDPKQLAEGDDGEMRVGALGREILLARELPSWRAALYPGGPGEPERLGDEYRRRKTHRSEARLASEIQEGRDQLASPKRDVRLRGLRTLGAIAPSWVAPDIKALEDGPERRLAALARQTLRQISGVDLPDRMLAFAENPKNDGHLRGLVYRVLAEHARARVAPKVAMLRIHPDARIQRAVVPIIAEEDPTEAGTGLASMLAANPAHEDRPGLSHLRLELIERLARLRDPRTLPALMAAYRAQPPPPPAEMLALSRALVAFPDPRAELALAEVARRLERPAIP